VIVVANFANRAYDSYNIGLPPPGPWYLRFNSDWSAYDPTFSNKGHDTTATPGPQHNLPFNANIAIGRYSAIILSQ
jgi:1,4-alpha-glucan branching enzyme